MDIRIFDVEHGDCALIIGRENEAVLVDCGYNATTNWRPAKGLAGQGFGTRRKLHHLILTHPDQDHLADLPNDGGCGNDAAYAPASCFAWKSCWSGTMMSLSASAERTRSRL